jgi:hypothetical protein
MASVVVLGTSHQLQGIQNLPSSIADPDYTDLVAQLICAHRIDSIFEEASGLGPTTAQGLAQSLGPNRYLDIDPPREERHKFGIAQETDSPQLIDPGDPSKSREIARWASVGEHDKREELWLRRVLEHDFANALIICGHFHTLSFAFRLRSAEFETKACHYMPHHKLRVLAVPAGTDDRTE